MFPGQQQEDEKASLQAHFKPPLASQLVNPSLAKASYRAQPNIKGKYLLTVEVEEEVKYLLIKDLIYHSDTARVQIMILVTTSPGIYCQILASRQLPWLQRQTMLSAPPASSKWPAYLTACANHRHTPLAHLQP